MFFEGRRSLTLHIDHLESLNGSGRAALAPPASATLVTKRVSLSGVESGPYCLKKVAPQYPIAAKVQHVQGKVVLWATVDQNGHVIDVRDVVGPQLLQKAATDAVRQWIYKPYLLDSEAIQFETEMHVIFNLGPR
jgi:protein TonB